MALTASELFASHLRDDAFWRNRRVFVTGHTGFKGTWLVLWLHRLGAVVGGFSLPPESQPCMFTAIGAQALCETNVGDVRSPTVFHAALRAFRPEIVVHLAAQALVRRSYAAPRETFDVNVLGTLNALEACRDLDTVRAIVICTSDKCYENDERGVPFCESDRLGGRDPYSASKACAELVTAVYRTSYFRPERYAEHRVAVASVRAGNVFGGGDWGFDRLIPDAVRAFSRGEAVRLRNPNARRPWQYVLEPLAGYLGVARALVEEGPTLGTPWNFGPAPDQAWSVSDVVAAFSAAWGGAAGFTVEPDADLIAEAGLLQLDASRARALLGWRPKLGIEAALERTANWYKAFYAGADAERLRRLTEAEIASYEAMSVGAAESG